MPHPNDGQLLTWLDAEMEPGEGTGVSRHLESCEECRDRVDLLRRDSEGFSRAVLVLDEQVAGLADPGPLPVARALSGAGRHRVRWAGWSLARAAGLVLVAAGAAAALVPGSPVREWLAGAGGSDAPAETAPAESPAGSLIEPVMEPGAAAISVELLEGGLEVSLQGFGRNSNVHVSLTGARRASVRVVGAAEGPRFVTGPGTLEVIGSTEGEIWVELPRSASEAAVTVDGATAVRLESGQLVILWPESDSLRGEVVFRIGD